MNINHKKLWLILFLKGEKMDLGNLISQRGERKD